MDEFTAPNQETGLSWITFGRIQKYVKLGFRVFRDFEKKNSPLCACEIYAYSYHVIKSAALCARSLSIVSFVELAA